MKTVLLRALFIVVCTGGGGLGGGLEPASAALNRRDPHVNPDPTVRPPLNTCPATGGNSEAVCERCSNHGICLPHNRCRCAAIWSGSPTCDRIPETLHQALKVHQPADGRDEIAGPYTHPFTLTRDTFDQVPRAEFETYHFLARTEGEFQALRRWVRGSAAAAPLQGRLHASCAVVSNSGALLTAALGRDIDKHDAVFRFAAAPTRGYEAHVGRCTTYRVVRRAEDAREYSSEVMLAHEFVLPWTPPCSQAPDQAQCEAFYQEVRSQFDQVASALPSHPHLLLLSPQYSSYVQSVLLGRNVSMAHYRFDAADEPASVGFVGAWLALHHCAQVTMYGFFLSVDQGYKHHYYDHTGKDQSVAVNRDTLEYRLSMRLADAGLIKLAPYQRCMGMCRDALVAMEKDSSPYLAGLGTRMQCALCDPWSDPPGLALTLLACLALLVLALLPPLVCCLPELVHCYIVLKRSVL